MTRTYEMLKAEVQRLRDEGRMEKALTPDERADWAYGTTVIENSSVTREMATKAVQAKDR